MVFHEPDEAFWVSFGATRSEKYLLISVGSKIDSSSGSPMTAPLRSASVLSMSTSPGALGQRPVTSRPPQTSSRAQKFTTPRSAL